MSKRLQFKHSIVDFLREDLDDSTIDMLDVFKYTGGQTLQVTHFGYRHLSNHYEFLDIEFQFDYTIKTFGTLTRAINGLFYYTMDKKSGIIKVWSTDHRFVNRIKLCAYRFDVLVKKYNIT